MNPDDDTPNKSTIDDDDREQITNELRMYLVVRGDITMSIGKAMGQAGHAFATALWQADHNSPDCVKRYYADDQPKIVVKCKNLNALLRAHHECLDKGLNCFLVTDAARTVFSEPTQTCFAVGPCYRTSLPAFILKMQLL